MTTLIHDRTIAKMLIEELQIRRMPHYQGMRTLVETVRIFRLAAGA